jgi:hypothetical protein
MARKIFTGLALAALVAAPAMVASAENVSVQVNMSATQATLPDGTKKILLRGVSSLPVGSKLAVPKGGAITVTTGTCTLSFSSAQFFTVPASVCGLPGAVDSAATPAVAGGGAGGGGGAAVGLGAVVGIGALSGAIGGQNSASPTSP